MKFNEYFTTETDLPAPGRRAIPFSVAITLSIVAHLSVLLLVSGRAPVGPLPERRISLELVQRSQAAAEAETPEEPPGVRPNATPSSDPHSSDERLAAPAAGLAARADSVVKNAAANRKIANGPTRLPNLAVRNVPEPAPIPKRVAQSGPAGEAPGGKVWEDSVRLELMNWLERHKRYPIAARRKGIQGAVLVRFVVSSDGALLEKELLQSSGSKHLDAAAMKLLSRAAPYPRLPEQLLADALEVRLPIEYRLVDGRHRT